LALLWFGFTALQHNIYNRLHRAGECSECEQECACRINEVDRTTLHPRTVGKFSSLHPTWGQTILHSRAVGIFYPPPNPQGEYIMT